MDFNTTILHIGITFLALVAVTAIVLIALALMSYAEKSGNYIPFIIFGAIIIVAFMLRMWYMDNDQADVTQRQKVEQTTDSIP